MTKEDLFGHIPDEVSEITFSLLIWFSHYILMYARELGKDTGHNGYRNSFNQIKLWKLPHSMYIMNMII